MVLSYDAYNDTLLMQKEKENQLDAFRKELDEIRELLNNNNNNNK
jgi:hypothetical protein